MLLNDVFVYPTVSSLGYYCCVYVDGAYTFCLLILLQNSLVRTQQNQVFSARE